MEFRCGNAGMACLLFGAVLVIIGTLQLTGFVHWGLPSVIPCTVVAYIIVIVGVIFIMLDRHSMAPVVRDYEETTNCRKLLGAVSDDDYLVDTTDGEWVKHVVRNETELTQLDQRAVFCNGFLVRLVPNSEAEESDRLEAVRCQKIIKMKLADNYIIDLEAAPAASAELPELTVLDDRQVKPIKGFV